MQQDTVLRRIKPSNKERMRVSSFAKKLEETAKRFSKLDAVICGSLGKGTWLSGNHDIDIFILFPKDTSREDLEKRGLEFGAAIYKSLKGSPEIRYSEHPYTSGIIDGFKVDIVPCYKIHQGEHIISAVDRSPLHLEFVRDGMKEEMKDEVLLLKQFCKSSGIYGSEAKTLGFSGYICEILVMKYESFLGVMKAASSWHLPYKIDLSGKAAASHSEIFVVIDPTDIHRNAAAIVSPYNIMKFIYRAKRFVQNPSYSFFTEQKIKPMTPAQISSLNRRETHFIGIQIGKPVVVDDIVYQQSRRALSRLESILKHNEFQVIRSCEHVGKDIILIFELELGKLPATKKMTGPPLFAKKHVEEFAAKYGDLVYVEGSNVAADKKRDYKTPSSLIESMMKKGEKELAALGIPNHMIKPFKSGKIAEQKTFFSLLKDAELSDFLRKMYFEKII